MHERRYLQACGVVKFRVKKPSFKNEEVCLLVLMNILQGSLVMMVMGGADRWATGSEFYTNSITLEILDLATRTSWVQSNNFYCFENHTDMVLPYAGNSRIHPARYWHAQGPPV